MNDKISQYGTAYNSNYLKKSINFFLFLLLIIVAIISLFIGRYPIDPLTIILIIISGIIQWIESILASTFGIKFTLFGFLQHTWPEAMSTVVWDVRLPRIISVILAGSSLALSGATYQGIFRNPLVSESILGVSAGAGVGAALGILMGLNIQMIAISAFIFGLIAVGMTFLISHIYKGNQSLILILAGIIVGGIFSAIMSLIKYVADPESKLPDIVFWLMGSFGKTSMDNLNFIAPIIIISTLVIIMLRWRLNILSMGEEEAKSLGIDTKKIRSIFIICSTLLTASAVCIGGLISWIGLIIPHISRMIIGPDHNNMLIASIMIGGTYLLIVDTICRTLTTTEIPISIVTSLCGAPIFLYLSYKTKNTWF